jgi:hypothetical protein
MKTLKAMFMALLLLCSAGIIFMTDGCKKDENKTAPDLPPKSSFVMDFQDFSHPEDTLASREIETYKNWGFSYANVAVWNAIITVGLAIPVASFVESFNHEAIYHPDQNNWTWSYNFVVNTIPYEAVLTGYIQTDSVVWEMRITKGGAFTDFLWYHGKSAVAGTGGFWILLNNPDVPQELLRIDWNKNSDGTSDIRYTNIVPGGAENGGYIFYGTTTADFDRFYHIFNKGQDNLTEIEWSSVVKNGHVRDPRHYIDDLWHCWDSTLKDIVCP